MVALDDPCEEPDYYFDLLYETIKVAMPLAFYGNLYMRCPLLAIPLEIRVLIWEALFMDDHSPIVIDKPPKTGFGTLAVLRVCHGIHHECSLALSSAMYRRKIVFKIYGSHSSPVLRHYRNPLRGCPSHFLNRWHKFPCTFDTIAHNGIFESVVFFLGGKDLDHAVRRRWEFAVFISALHSYDDIPVKIRTLTIVGGDNWKFPGFDERDIVLSLFKGVFAFVEKIKFDGFSLNERALLNQHLYMRSITGWG